MQVRGTRTVQGAMSAVCPVEVHLAVDVKQAASRIVRGDATTIVVSVSPTQAGRLVRLQRAVANSGNYRSVTRRTLDRNSQTVFTVKGTDPGAYDYRVVIDGTRDNGPGQSQRLRINVK